MSAHQVTPKHWGAVAVAVTALLGGHTALAGAAAADATFDFDVRIAGEDRFATAVRASQEAFPAGGAGAVVLVNAYRVVDGLTASYVAGSRTAPVLFTEAGDLPSATEGEIQRLGARSIHLVGGTGVISSQVEAQLVSDGYEVTRLGGADRFETAAAVATSGGTNPGAVVVASGVKLSDALVIGPLAYARGYPIVLVDGDVVPAATTGALDRLAAGTAIVVGGTTVVGEGAYARVSADVRLDGPERDGTAVEVARYAVEVEGFRPDSLGLVGDQDASAVDALVAATVAGAGSFPLLFADGNGIAADTAAHLRSHAAQLTGTGYVFGGTGAVPTSAAAAASAAAK